LTESWRQELYRAIPKVDEFLEEEVVRRALAEFPRWVVLDTVRELLERRRRDIARLTSSDSGSPAVLPLPEEFSARLSVHALPRLRPLINATGIIVHTNLGRSVLPPDVVARADIVARGYSNLEYDLSAGGRGSRQDLVGPLLCRLTGAEAALAVNNNAAAVLLCLATLADRREVIVSRGQLVEIGGSFRIPDVMTRSGAVLREVGTTNKTHLHDYRDAVGPDTALFLKVHTSNFQVVGFTSSVSTAALAALGREADIPVVEDLGSGCLVDLSPFGLRGEPTVRSIVADGADIVTFSGDKLLGGPQAGLIVGRQSLLERIQRNPLLRALRPDKVTLAALEATLRVYNEGEKAFEKIPTLRMISEPAEEVRRRARRLLRRLDADTRRLLGAVLVPSAAQVGGGALPLQEIPSFALALGTADRPAHRLEEGFRNLPTPVIGRIFEDRLLLDMRTVDAGETGRLADCLAAVAAS
jgi:L-seryl-tRNA(Ser) seleniumtransferase